jgi:hypothetical protein
MKKSTLIAIADIVNNLDRSSRDLYMMLDTLNITEEERIKIEEMITTITEKLIQLRRSNISELDNHIDVNYIETRISKY